MDEEIGKSDAFCFYCNLPVESLDVYDFFNERTILLMDESSGVIKEIKGKIKDLRAKGFNLYPSGFKRDITVEDVVRRLGAMDNDELK